MRQRLTSIRKSTYVRRSVKRQLKEKVSINPFVEFKDFDDYRYFLRGSTQVLFSSREIDSKHIDLISQAPNITLNEGPPILQNPMQVEWSSMESCFGFISNSLKNQKEWNNQNQILRVKNKDEKHDNNEKDKRPRLFGIEKYEGVNMKTYLRGTLNYIYYF